MPPISVDQFRAQVQQTTNLDAKVKMDGGDGLKTYGTGFFGKIACWFQKSSERKTQSHEVRQSFIDSIRQAFGNDAIVDDVVGSLAGNKRLSLRTIQQSLQRLDSHTDRMNDIFTDLGEKMGFEPPRTLDGKLDMAQLGDLKREIAQDIQSMRARGQDVTEEQARNITRGKIENYILQNKPVNTAQDGFKLLSHVSTNNIDQAIDKVFDSLISKEGGLDMLKTCSLQLLDQEFAGCNPSTYLRGNTTSIKLTARVLEQMTTTGNQTLLDSIEGGFPETMPPKQIPDPTSPDPEHPRLIQNPEYERTTLNLAQSVLGKITDTWARGVTGDTRKFLDQIHQTASRYQANIGSNPGYKTACHFLGLRLINPMIVKEGVKLAGLAQEAKKSGNEELFNKLMTLKSTMVDIGKGIQIIANVTAGGDQGELIGKLGFDSRYLASFIANQQNQTDFSSMVTGLCIPPTRD